MQLAMAINRARFSMLAQCHNIASQPECTKVKLTISYLPSTSSNRHSNWTSIPDSQDYNPDARESIECIECIECSS